MVFYVIVVTFLVTFLMNEFRVVSWMIEIWMKFMPVLETNFGIFCILTFM